MTEERTVRSGIMRAYSISPSPSWVTPHRLPEDRKEATRREDEADSSRTVASRCGNWSILAERQHHQSQCPGCSKSSVDGRGESVSVPG